MIETKMTNNYGEITVILKKGFVITNLTAASKSLA